MEEKILKLIKLESLSNNVSFYIFNEGDNPTGTHKDRIAKAHVQDCIKRGSSHITLASCGNYGVSVAYFAQKENIKVTVFIPTAFDSPRILQIKESGAEVIRLPLSYESCVEESRKFAQSERIYDANPGGENSKLQIEVYAQMMNEIYSKLSSNENLLAVSVSVSNGTTLAGLFKGAKPSVKIIGGTTYQNPIYTSFQKKLTSPEILNEDDLKETAINEPLINWKALDAEEALRAVYDSKGKMYAATDEELIEVQKLLAKEGISSHPSGCAGVYALKKYIEESDITLPCSVVAVMTSRDY